MEKNAAETTVIYSVIEGSPMAMVLTRLAEKAQRYGKEQRSVQYWAEDMLSRGCETFNNYLDADKERRDTAKFNAELSKLPAPNPNEPESLIKYGTAIVALQRKYGIGGEQKTL